MVNHLKQSGKPNYVDEILQEPTEAILVYLPRRPASNWKTRTRCSTRR